MKNYCYARNTAFTFAAQCIILCLSFATNILIARLLGPEGKGIITLAALFPFIIAMILALGLDEATVFTLGKDRGKHSAVLSNFLFVWIIVSIISLPLLYALREQIITHLLKGINYTYFIFIIVSIPFFLLFRYTRAAFQGHNDFHGFNKFLILQSVLTFIFSVFLIPKYKIQGGIISFCIAILLSSIICYNSLRRYGRGDSLDLKLLKGSLAYGLKAEPGVVLNFFNLRLDIFILNFFAGPAEVGIYSIAVIFAELIAKIPESFGTTLFPKIAQLSNLEGNKFTVFVIRNVFVIMLVSGVLLAIFVKPLLLMFFGPQFSPSVIPFWILLPGVLFLGITKIICSNFQGQGKPEFGTYLTIVSVILTILLNILLIPHFKSTGAAISSTISYSTSFLLAITIFKRRSKVSIHNIFKPEKKVFSNLVKIIRSA